MFIWVNSLWIVAHYTASHLYTRLCTPLTLWGFLSSPFLVTTPHCEVLRWTVYTGGTTIRFAWMALSVSLIKHFGRYLYKDGVPT